MSTSDGSARAIGLFAPLVEYPGPDFAAAVAAAREAFGGDPEVATGLETLARAVEQLGLSRLQERYVDAFELRGDRSLYLGHQLFGEDLRRNVLLTRLKRACARWSIPCEPELPDHLGMVLRVAAREPPGEDTDELLGECLLPMVRRLAHATADDRELPHRALFGALAEALTRQLEAEKAACPSSCSSPSPISR